MPRFIVEMPDDTLVGLQGGFVVIKRPVLRYHGGKWMLAPWIISHFPTHRVYVEPFGGGASVLLRKKRSYSEIYNDLDGEIVNVFRVLRDNGDELRRLLYLTPFSRDEFLEAYKPSDCALESARRTIIKSFMGFGSNAIHKKSGFRSNSNRSGTTPAHDWKNYAEVFDLAIERIRGVVIENRDAAEVMSAHDSPQTLHYVDPPYVFSTRTDDGSDYAHEMSDQDHVDLSRFLMTLEGKVIVSGYESELYDSAYMGWRKITRRALADGARERVEAIWLSPNIEPNQGILI